MNTDGIVERLSDRTGLKKKTCEKIITSIIESIESDLAIGIPFTIESVGTINKSSSKTTVQSLSDGSFKVIPPKSYSEFLPYSDSDSLKALRSAQRVISALASGVIDSYKDAKKSYKAFSRIIHKSLSKGKKVKISGIGVSIRQVKRILSDLPKLSSLYRKGLIENSTITLIHWKKK